MDKQRRRELKRLGAKQVAEESAAVRAKLYERNPFPVGHPNWVANLQAEYRLNRAYRQNRQNVVRVQDIQETAEVHSLGFRYEPGDRMVPHAGRYLQCTDCTDLVPTNCEVRLACSCGTIVVDPISRSYDAPAGKHAVVELLGKGPNRRRGESLPWWKFWR